jgi:hypothetical protein
MTELSAKYSKWKLDEKYESDEFSTYISSTGDPHFEETYTRNPAPRKRKDLVPWLREAPSEFKPFYKDDWREVCRKRPASAVFALSALADQGMRHGNIRYNAWHDALLAWAEMGRQSSKPWIAQRILLGVWRRIAPQLLKMSVEALQKIARPVTDWMQYLPKSVETEGPEFMDLCRHVLALPFEDEDKQGADRPPITEAINHPIGHITEMLLDMCFRRKPNDNDRLPTDIEPFFARICDKRRDGKRTAKFRHGRVILASRLISLFRLDREWTETHLLPLLNWEREPDEARGAWEGFLWAPRLHQPLFAIVAFKSQFLETARHYDELGKHREQFATVLTYAALELTEDYTTDELRQAFASLPQQGLDEAASALWRALESVGPSENYWTNRIRPFWKKIWPKSRDKRSERLNHLLMRLIIATGNELPNALDIVHDWLQNVPRPEGILIKLEESGLCKKFPEPALRLLDAMIGQPAWRSKALGKCLDDIAEAAPHLKQDQRWQRLSHHAQKGK